MPRGGRGSHSTSVPIPLFYSTRLDAGELCGKGYSRMNEFEAHESSYDHQHKKRFMEMKQMQKGASSVEARRERERRAEEKAGFIAIKPIKQIGNNGVGGETDEAAPTTGKRGFKSAFGSEEGVKKGSTEGVKPKPSGFKKAFAVLGSQEASIRNAEDVDDHAGEIYFESDTEDEGFDRYNPANPTL